MDLLSPKNRRSETGKTKKQAKHKNSKKLEKTSKTLKWQSQWALNLVKQASLFQK